MRMPRHPWLPLALILLGACAAPARSPGVVVLTEPGPVGSALHAAADEHGVLEAVALDGRGILFARAPEWSAAIRVAEGPASGGGRMVVGPRGRRAVVWEDGDERIRVAVSADGGRTWSAGGLQAGGEQPDAAWLDGDRLAVVWPGSGPEGEGPLLLATSSDGGRTFGAARPAAPAAPTACTCCRPALAADSAGSLWVAYRTSVAGVKGLALLRGREDGLQPLPVPSDPWPFRGCPRDGPSLAVAPAGNRAAVLWSRGPELRLASSRDGATFSEAVPLGPGHSHFAAADASGTLVVGWTADDGIRLLQVDGPSLPVQPTRAKASLVATAPGVFTLLVPGP